MFYQCPMGTNSFEDVVDKVNIRELVEFERYCMEQGLWDAMDSCYLDNGYVTDCWIKGSIRDYIAAARTSVIPAKGGTTRPKTNIRNKVKQILKLCVIL